MSAEPNPSDPRPRQRHNAVVLALLATYSWQEVRYHPWRSATAVLAVMLGVALAFSVHLINASALDEFSSAARSAGGQPDLELRAAQGAMDEALYARIAADPRVALASPVLELQTLALTRDCLLYTSPSPRDGLLSRMPSSA